MLGRSGYSFQHFGIDLRSFFFSFFFLPIYHRFCLKRTRACDFPIPNFVSERTLKLKMSNRAIDSYDLFPKRAFL